ncbi:MAG: hypothetical protein V3U62_08545 [Sedimenticolaceae bacterium]
MGDRPINFDESTQLLLHKQKALPGHAHGMVFTADDGREMNSAAGFTILLGAVP